MAQIHTPEALAHIEACREAARRYSRGIDRLDADEMKSAYWPDATDDHGVFVGNAHEFADRCVGSHDRFAWTMHSTYNHVVEVDDDGASARGEAHVITHLMHGDRGTLDTFFGRYLDTYERRGDEWRILHRVCVHEGSRSEPANPMQMDATSFRQGSFDRSTPGRPIGP